jgi:hypothetical protein
LQSQPPPPTPTTVVVHGPTGSGKTALVSAVLRDAQVLACFECVAWVPVGLHPDAAGCLELAWQQITGGRKPVPVPLPPSPSPSPSCGRDDDSNDGGDDLGGRRCAYAGQLRRALSAECAGRTACARRARRRALTRRVTPGS